MSLYATLLNMWVAGKIDKAKLDTAVSRGWITQAQEDEILATPQQGS